MAGLNDSAMTAAPAAQRGWRRRDLLRGVAAALALAPLRVRGGSSALERRQPMGLKLSCSSLAFSDMSWQAALEEIKKLGFRYAELAMCEGWAHVSPSALTEPEPHGKKIAEFCDRLGMDPIAVHAGFALGDRTQFPGLTVADPAARKTILAHFERVVACARAAEVPLIRVQPGRFLDELPREACIKNATEMLEEMHAMAARRNIALAFENQTASIAEQPADALELLTAVPGLRLDYDISHIVANSISLEQTSELMKHVGHIAVRNAKPGSSNEPVRGGQLSYPIQDFIDAFRAQNVNAYVAVEYYEPAMRDSIPILKKILEHAGVPA
jgi:sugar phosphate isomerase/epimerase